jgi:hypothetical protein
MFGLFIDYFGVLYHQGISDIALLWLGDEYWGLLYWPQAVLVLGDY